MPQWPYASTTGRRVAGDPDVERLLTGTSRLLARLPGNVIENQRAALVRALAEAGDGLVVEIHVRPAVVLVRDGSRPLVKIPANGGR